MQLFLLFSPCSFVPAFFTLCSPLCSALSWTYADAHRQATTRKLILIFFSPVLPSLPSQPYTHCVHYLLLFVSYCTRLSLPFLARSKLVPHAPLAAVELKNALSAAYSYSWVLSGREKERALSQFTLSTCSLSCARVYSVLSAVIVVSLHRQ